MIFGYLDGKYVAKCFDYDDVYMACDYYEEPLVWKNAGGFPVFKYDQPWERGKFINYWTQAMEPSDYQEIDVVLAVDQIMERIMR